MIDLVSRRTKIYKHERIAASAEHQTPPCPLHLLSNPHHTVHVLFTTSHTGTASKKDIYTSSSIPPLWRCFPGWLVHTHATVRLSYLVLLYCCFEKLNLKSQSQASSSLSINQQGLASCSIGTASCRIYISTTVACMIIHILCQPHNFEAQVCLGSQRTATLAIPRIIRERSHSIDLVSFHFRAYTISGTQKY